MTRTICLLCERPILSGEEAVEDEGRTIHRDCWLDPDLHMPEFRDVPTDEDQRLFTIASLRVEAKRMADQAQACFPEGSFQRSQLEILAKDTKELADAIEWATANLPGRAS